MSAIDEARREIADWDPFTPEPTPIASLTVGNEAAERRPSKRKSKSKPNERRSASRDLPSEFDAYVTDLLEDHEASSPYVPMVELCNAFNIKFNVLEWYWSRTRERRRRDGHDQLSAGQRAECERAAAVRRQLAPLRHLIALAHDPMKAEDGEIDTAAGGLDRTAAATLRQTIAKVALAIDLASQLRELRETTLAELFAAYGERIEDAGESTLRSLVVEWCRDHRSTPSIYPPGFEQPQREADEDGAQ